MASKEYTVERMLETRVARRKELTAFPESFVDTVIPRYRRKLYSIIGKSVFEDPAMRPAITVQRPFSFSLIEVEPGNGAGLHSHTTEGCSCRSTASSRCSGATRARTRSCSARSTPSPCRSA